MFFQPGEISSSRHQRKRRRAQNLGVNTSLLDGETDDDMKKLTRDKRSTRLQLSDGPNKLNQLEEEFIYAAEFGDIPTVERILRGNPSFSVDYSDILGRTPLRLAVGNEHLEVVELLLDRCNHHVIHEALLQAINAGHEQIAETILKHPKYKDGKKENKRIGETDYFYATTSEDSQFSSDITPLILAAERNQFEIVQLLLLRGENIQKPHHYYCNCQECSNKLQFDQLRLAKTRLNAYKGLASGAYISLSSKDPIITAFDLARELRRVARVEKYFKKDYLNLADQLSQYVVKLLDKVRGHDELELLLDKATRNCDEEKYERLSRLKLAIHYNEKKFVAHSSCQQKLVSIWYGDLRYLERSNWFLRINLVLLIAITYPLVAIAYWFIPTSRVGRFLRIPCIKFIGHTMFFVIFLIMIIISSLIEVPQIASFQLATFNNITYTNYVRNIHRLSVENDAKLVLRTASPQLIHILLSTWIIGMLWQEIKQLYNDGLYVYSDSVYNILDFTVLILYVSSFALRYVSIVKVSTAVSYLENPSVWVNLSDYQFRYHFYWLAADRYTWNSWDPHIVCEGLFAMANVISFARVTYLMPANELFGPMQISLAKMASDVFKFFSILLTLFLAFMVGLHNLYWYYPQSVRIAVENPPRRNVHYKADGHFGILEKTFQTVFWSIFGRGDSDVVELGQFEHYFTQNVGYIIYGAYNIALVVVMLNMLIAMMSQSFEMIQAEADIEWKFARTKLYMEFINDGTTLPVPFNIVPTIKSCVNIVAFVKELCCRKEPDPKPHPGRIKDLEMFAPPTPSGADKRAWRETDNENKGIKHFQSRMSTSNGFVRSVSDAGPLINITYQRVMKRIVKRYIFDMQRESDNAEGDMDELKQDISSFRYEMLNHLKAKHKDDNSVLTRLDSLERNVYSILDKQTAILKNITTRQDVRSNSSSSRGDNLLDTSVKNSNKSVSFYDVVSPESALSNNGAGENHQLTENPPSELKHGDQSKGEDGPPNQLSPDAQNQTVDVNVHREPAEREQTLNKRQIPGPSVVDLEDIVVRAVPRRKATIGSIRRTLESDVFESENADEQNYPQTTECWDIKL